MLTQELRRRRALHVCPARGEVGVRCYWFSAGCTQKWLELLPIKTSDIVAPWCTPHKEQLRYIRYRGDFLIFPLSRSIWLCLPIISHSHRDSRTRPRTIVLGTDRRRWILHVVWSPYSNFVQRADRRNFLQDINTHRTKFYRWIYWYSVVSPR